MKMDEIMKRNRWATDPAAYSRHVRCLRARKPQSFGAWVVFALLQTGAVCVGIALAHFVAALMGVLV